MSLRRSFVLVRDARALTQPARSQDHQERDAQPADDRIHAADQLLEAHQRGRIPQRDTPMRTMRMRFVDPPEKRRAVAKKSEKTVL